MKEKLEDIIKLFESSSLSSLKLVRDDFTIELKRDFKENVRTELVEQKHVKQDTVPETKTETPSYLPVKAPLVGTYYEAPAPDQPPFVRLGQTVKKGEVIFIVEAMKVMNEITAPSNGVIKKINIKNGDMVMYDTVVMEIE